MEALYTNYFVWYTRSMLTIGYPVTFLGEGNIDHALVPFTPITSVNNGWPVYISQTDTRGEVVNYAAGGFHTSVSRGIAGGCQDPDWVVKPTGVTWVSGPKACATPKNNPDIAAAWEKAAAKYREVYEAVNAVAKPSSAEIDAFVLGLRNANWLADIAYGLENVPPPRDPNADPEGPPATPKSRISVAMAGLGLLAAFGFVAFAIASSKKEEKPAPGEFPVV